MRVYIVLHNVSGKRIGGVYNTYEAALAVSDMHNARVASQYVDESE